MNRFVYGFVTEKLLYKFRMGKRSRLTVYLSGSSILEWQSIDAKLPSCDIHHSICMATWNCEEVAPSLNVPDLNVLPLLALGVHRIVDFTLRPDSKKLSGRIVRS